MSKKTKGIFLALLSSSIFGLIPILSIPLMKGGIEISTILFYRFLFSSIIMGGICLFKQINIQISLKALGSLFLLSILFAATSLGLIASYSLILSGVSTTIHYLFPILVVFIMVVFYKEKSSFSILGLSLLAFIGVGLLCWTNGGSLNLTGIGFALGTVVTYAVYLVGINKFGLSDINTYTITFYILFFGTIVFSVYALLTTGIQAISIHNGQIWLHLILLAFLTTVVSDYLLILAIKYAGASLASILGIMEPVVAFGVGVMFLAEPLSTQGIIGLVLILFSVTMVVIISAKKKKR